MPLAVDIPLAPPKLGIPPPNPDMPEGIVAKHPVKTIEENIVNPNFMVNNDLFFIFIFCLFICFSGEENIDGSVSLTHSNILGILGFNARGNKVRSVKYEGRKRLRRCGEGLKGRRKKYEGRNH